MKYAVVSSVVLLLFGAHPAQAQQTTPCRVLCTPEFKVEPTITFTNLFGSPRTISNDGVLTREPSETEFEVILSLGLPTRLTWLDFTIEAIFLPFKAEGRWLRGVELEGSFDYVASGLPKAGDTSEGRLATWTMPARGHSRWCSFCPSLPSRNESSFEAKKVTGGAMDHPIYWRRLYWKCP